MQSLIDFPGYKKETSLTENIQFTWTKPKAAFPEDEGNGNVVKNINCCKLLAFFESRNIGHVCQLMGHKHFVG